MDLRSSFENEILKENPAATRQELDVEWAAFIKEYDEWNFRQAAQFARGNNECKR